MGFNIRDLEFGEIEKELMKNVNINSAREVEKVKRYLNLLDIYYQLDDAIKKQGPVVTTENGKQSFVKTHPAIDAKNKINTALLSLEKTFTFIDSDQDDDGL